MTDRPEQNRNRTIGGAQGDDHSPAALYHAALGALVRALASDDERVSLRAAQLVFTLLGRGSRPLHSALDDLDDPNDPTPANPARNKKQVIELRYAEVAAQKPADSAEHPDYNPGQPTAPRPGTGAGFPGAVQSGGLRTALGQDGDGQDRGD